MQSGIVDTFIYNGDGQRIQQQDSTGTSKEVWDGENILLETNASNIIQAVYTLEPLFYGNLISQSRSGVDSFYLFDGQGSTRQLVSSTISVTDSYLYDSFGNIVLTNGTTVNPFRFVGQLGYYLAADLLDYHLRARYFDPHSGRFLSRDAIDYSLFEVNKYEYASNNTSNKADPSGRFQAGPPFKPIAPPKPGPGIPPGFTPAPFPPGIIARPGGAPPGGCSVPSVPPLGQGTLPTIPNCSVYSLACHLGNAWACNGWWACMNAGNDPANSCVRACLQTVGFPPPVVPFPAPKSGYPATSPDCWCNYLQHLACFAACAPRGAGVPIPPWNLGGTGFNWCTFSATCRGNLLLVLNNPNNPFCINPLPCNGPGGTFPVPIGGPPGPCKGW
jgi:RHS repeat-associated protein